MPWIAGQSQAGYDWTGDLYELTAVLEADSSPFIMTRSIMPGGLALPLIPLLRYREGFLDVEVRG